MLKLIHSGEIYVDDYEYRLLIEYDRLIDCCNQLDGGYIELCLHHLEQARAFWILAHGIVEDGD